MNWKLILRYGFGIVGGLLMAWGLYAGLIRPTTKPNPTQEAATINNYYNQPRFGCMRFQVYEREVKK